jgi:hypothetical protein
MIFLKYKILIQNNISCKHQGNKILKNITLNCYLIINLIVQNNLSDYPLLT